MHGKATSTAAKVVLGLAVALGLSIVLAGPMCVLVRSWGYPGEMGSVFRRLWLGLALVVLAWALRPWRDVPAGGWGLWGPNAKPLHVVPGAGLAILLLGAIAAAQALAGWITWDHAEGASKWSQRWPEAIARGVIVAVVEETFFRGWLLDRCRARWKPFAAALVAAALFALPHVFKASAAPRGLPTTPAGAIEALSAWATNAIDLAASLPRLAALFLMGVALAAARLRTGSLWLGIGLHGTALVFMAASSALTERAPERNWAGTKWLYDGAPAWVLFALLAFFLWPRRGGAAGPPGGASSRAGGSATG